MKIFLSYLALALFCLVLIASSPAIAQIRSELAEQNYRRTVDTIMAREYSGKVPYDLNFNYLRAQYTATQYYDPFSDSLALIDKIALEIKKTQNPSKRTRLLELYRATVRDQIANLSVVTRAWQLAKDDPVFGNPDFFNTVRSALFSTIVRSGTGRDLKSAYDIITLDEEIFLLKYLGVRVLDTIAQKTGAYYYNIHSVIDEKTGQHHELYVNTSYPMKFLALQKREKERLERERKILK